MVCQPAENGLFPAGSDMDGKYGSFDGFIQVSDSQPIDCLYSSGRISLWRGTGFFAPRNGTFRDVTQHVPHHNKARSAQQQKPFSSLISTSLPCKTPAKNGCLRFFHSYFKAATHVRFPVSQFYSVKNFYCVKCIFIHQKEWIYNSEWI